MEEFIGLRLKFYTFKVFEGNETKKDKGVKKNVQNKICFSDFEKCLLTKEPVYRKQVLFRTNHHNIYTVNKTKSVECSR
jgi:hypothetical protein